MTGLNPEQTKELAARYLPGKEMDVVRRALLLRDGRLDWLLRDHTIDKKHWVTEWRDINRRNAFDSLLSLVSALTVAKIATGKFPELSSDLRNLLFEILSDLSVRAYYELRYPLPLPILFCYDLATPVVATPAMLDDASVQITENTRYLVSFFELDARTTRDKALAFFLDVMDDYNFEDIDIDDILEVIESPRLYEREIRRRSRWPSDLQLGVAGLEAFLAFVGELHDLLGRVQNQPLLRAAIWCHFCYWFGNGGAGAQYTSARLQKTITRWTKRGTASPVARIFGEQLAKSNLALRDLTDWKKYAMPLVREVTPVLDRWSKLQIKE